MCRGHNYLDRAEEQAAYCWLCCVQWGGVAAAAAAGPAAVRCAYCAAAVFPGGPHNLGLRTHSLCAKCGVRWVALLRLLRMHDRSVAECVCAVLCLGPRLLVRLAP